MSNNDEHIVVNLKSEDEHESVRNLSSAEKRKVNNVCYISKERRVLCWGNEGG